MWKIVIISFEKICSRVYVHPIITVKSNIDIKSKYQNRFAHFHHIRRGPPGKLKVMVIQLRSIGCDYLFIPLHVCTDMWKGKTLNNPIRTGWTDCMRLIGFPPFGKMLKLMVSCEGSFVPTIN